MKSMRNVYRKMCREHGRGHGFREWVRGINLNDAAKSRNEPTSPEASPKLKAVLDVR